MKISTLMRIALPMAFLAGCGSAGLPPIEKGQTPVLAPNQGVAVVVMDTLDTLNQISVEPTEGDGPSMNIPKTPIGVNMYVFVVPAGHYCLTSFWLGSTRIHQSDEKHGICFDVIAGKTAYSGNIAPRAYGPSDLRTNQNYDWRGFEAAMKADYPDIVAKYPIVTP